MMFFCVALIAKENNQIVTTEVELKSNDGTHQIRLDDSNQNVPQTREEIILFVEM